MQKNALYRHFLFLVSLCFIATVLGCSDSSKNNSKEINGSAVKGIISDGIISIYNPEQPTILLSQSRTNQLGQFSFKPDGLNLQLPALIELSVDEATRMRCDLVEGCITPHNGHLVSFGNLAPLPMDFKLYGLINQDNSGKISANVNPLTHLVVTTSLKHHNQLTPNSIQISQRWIEDAFALNASPLGTQLKDISLLANMPLITEEQLKQSIFSAVLYPETLESDWKNGNTTLDELDLRDILNRAASLTVSLSNHLNGQNPVQEQALNRIQSSTEARLEELNSNEITILTQPDSLSLTLGSAFSFSVQAKSDYPLTYQWYLNGQPISGANQAVFSKASSSDNDAGLYHVVVSNDSHQVSSLSANLALQAPMETLRVVTQPQGQTLTASDTLVLRVTASGGQGNISYRWQRNGSLIPGANSNQLLISSIQAADAGAYRAVISDQIQTIYSDFVNVWVTEPIIPISITQQPISQTIIEGNTAIFSVQAQGGGFLNYQWRRNGQAISGAHNNSFSISDVALTDEANYDVVVSNSQGSATSQIARLEVIPNIPPIIISSQPQSRTVIAGNSTSLSISILNPESVSYQWYFNNQAILNATSATFSLASAQEINQGEYYVVVSNANMTLRSETASILVDPVPLHSVELSWDAPLFREDGSSLRLTDINGYVIQYRRESNGINQEINIEGASNTSYILRDLPAGTLFLSIATIDSELRQGEFSQTISIELP